jgi:hypothetical protein
MPRFNVLVRAPLANEGRRSSNASILILPDMIQPDLRDGHLSKEQFEIT